ncbi:MAG: L-rhamnose isomerase [Lachnospiraceae bacterium]|nr:L-rhamnose isomerase [Lachnospiraceae bacterium]
MTVTGENYKAAREIYARAGVDTDEALRLLNEIPVSIHCWQIDDLGGFENPDRGLSGGIQATGSDPSKARTKEEFMTNLTKALSMVPGKNKLALHAVYLDNLGKFVDRDEITPENFAFWVEYAKEHQLGLDFNPTYFSHDKAESNFTLSSYDPAIREFWVEHGKRCRKISEYFGRELGQTSVNNHWIPDGYKDYTIDKLKHRELLMESMDEILKEKIDWKYCVDSFESKLFGLGLESYTVGSHEFYSNYAAIRNNCIVCMDMGHFHPTEAVSSKLSSYLVFDRQVQLHVSRPVRWDSDHVVVLDDELKEVMLEIKRQNAFDKVHIGTDYFDGSINRIAAQALGARSVKKALLYALLEPTDKLKEYEEADDLVRRLVYSEEHKAMPFGLVWEQFCEMNNVPGSDWLEKVL